MFEQGSNLLKFSVILLLLTCYLVSAQFFRVCRVIEQSIPVTTEFNNCLLFPAYESYFQKTLIFKAMSFGL